MNFWIMLWKACLIGSLAIFAVVSLIVTVGGAIDVRRLLRKLKNQ